MISPLVQVRSLCKGYQEGSFFHPILVEAEAVLFPGEVVALLGPSGSGKSTLLNLLSGIDTPDGGEVWVDGVCLTALGEKERTLFRRRRMGFVFQFFHLLPTLTVGENVRLPLELTGRGGREAVERARSLLAAVGMEGREEAYPDRLSGGEQQRVAVARALAHDPTLVLADEPTGNLDREAGERVMEILTDLVRRRGATLLVATHSDQVAARADRILRIRDGALVEEGVKNP